MNPKIVTILFLINFLQFGVSQINYVGEPDFDEPIPRTVNQSCSCGVKQKPKIVGGQQAELFEYPWVSALCFNFGTGCLDFFFCAGTLVNDKFVITAAHCVVFLADPSQILVSLNNPYLDTTAESDDVTVVPLQITIHADYDAATSQNDIAIIELPRVPILATLFPICLPPNIKPLYPNKDVFAAGWGTLSSGGPLPDPLRLREVKLVALSNRKCKRSGYPDELIQPTMICATRTRRDTCQGDSGGPLMFNRIKRGFGQRLELIGVTSFGFGCADPDFPGVYTRVNQYLTWINPIIKTGTYCRNQFSPVG